GVDPPARPSCPTRRSSDLFSGSITSALSGTHTDTATASGTATDDLGHTALVTASDSANYLGVNPSIAIDKQIGFGTTWFDVGTRPAEHTSQLQTRGDLGCR